MSIDTVKPTQIKLDVYILVIYYQKSHDVSTTPFSSHFQAQQTAVDYCRSRLVNRTPASPIWKLSENPDTYAQFLEEYNEMRGYSEIQIHWKVLAV